MMLIELGWLDDTIFISVIDILLLEDFKLVSIFIMRSVCKYHTAIFKWEIV